MSETTVPTTETAEPNDAAEAAFTSRIRTSLALAQTRLTEVAKARTQWTSRVGELPKIPAQVQAAVDKAIDNAKIKLRDTLDLPSREDLLSLAQRIEALDARIANLSAEPAEIVSESRKAKKTPARKTPAKKPPAKKTPAKKKAVDKGKRREDIRAAASKSKPKKSSRK